MSPQEFAERSQALLDVSAGIPLDELERRARALTAMAKAVRAVGEVERTGGVFEADDDQLDAAGEQRLRDDLLRRLADLAAELAADEGAGEDGAG